MVVEIEYLDLDFKKKMLLLEYVLRDWIDFGKYNMIAGDRN